MSIRKVPAILIPSTLAGFASWVMMLHDAKNFTMSNVVGTATFVLVGTCCYYLLKEETVTPEVKNGFQKKRKERR